MGWKSGDNISGAEQWGLGVIAQKGPSIFIESVCDLFGWSVGELEPETFSSLDRTGINSFKVLETMEENTNVVPLVYGERRLGSNIIWRQTNEAVAGAINKDYWAVQVIAQGPIENVEKVFIGTDLIEKSETDDNHWGTTYSHLNVEYNTLPEEGIHLKDIRFNTTSDHIIRTWEDIINGTINSNIFTHEGDDWDYFTPGGLLKTGLELREEFRTIYGIDGEYGSAYAGGTEASVIAEGLWKKYTGHPWEAFTPRYTEDDNYLIFEFPTERNLEKLTFEHFGGYYGAMSDNIGTYSIQGYSTIGMEWLDILTDLPLKNNKWYANDGEYGVGGCYGGIHTNYIESRHIYKKWRIKFHAGIDISGHYEEINTPWRFTRETGGYLGYGVGISKSGYGFSDPEGYVGQPDWGVFKVDMTVGDYVETTTFPKEIAFASVHQVFEWDENAHTSLDEFTFQVKGKLIRRVTDENTISVDRSYSANPVEQIIDIIQTYLGYDDSYFDIPDFYDCRVACDEYGFESNIVFQGEGPNISTCLTSILKSFNGILFFVNNKWKLKMLKKGEVPSMYLTEKDIMLNTLNITMPSMSELANSVVVNYINKDDNYLAASEIVENKRLRNIDERDYQKVFDIPSVTSSIQANKLAQIILNKNRFSEIVDEETGQLTRLDQTPLFVTFSTSAKNTELEIGDIINLNHPLLDKPRNFFVNSIEVEYDNKMNIVASEYCETHFKDDNGNYII